MSRDMQRVVAAHEDAEELAVDARDGVEGLHRSAGARGFGHRDRIEAPPGRGRVIDLGQGRQIPRIALLATLAIAEEVGHALPQRNPPRSCDVHGGGPAAGREIPPAR